MIKPQEFITTKTEMNINRASVDNSPNPRAGRRLRNTLLLLLLGLSACSVAEDGNSSTEQYLQEVKPTVVAAGNESQRVFDQSAAAEAATNLDPYAGVLPETAAPGKFELIPEIGLYQTVPEHLLLLSPEQGSAYAIEMDTVHGNVEASGTIVEVTVARRPDGTILWSPEQKVIYYDIEILTAGHTTILADPAAQIALTKGEFPAETLMQTMVGSVYESHTYFNPALGETPQAMLADVGIIVARVPLKIHNNGIVAIPRSAGKRLQRFTELPQGTQLKCFVYSGEARAGLLVTGTSEVRVDTTLDAVIHGDVPITPGSSGGGCFAEGELTAVSIGYFPETGDNMGVLVPAERIYTLIPNRGFELD